MKHIVLLMIFLFLFSLVKSQTDTSYWKAGGDFTLQYNQSYFQNWNAGGEKSWAFGTIVNSFARYNDGTHSWDNTLFLGLGYINTESNATRKTDDKIEITSKYGRKAFNDFSYTANLNFKTQFFEGINFNNNTRISDFMAPGYLNISAGLDYKPSDKLSVYYSPLSGRIIFVLDDSLSAIGAFGVLPGQRVRPELGSYFVVQSRYEVFKNVIYQTKLDLFWNYTPEHQKDLWNIDVMWDNSILFKVNSILSFMLTVNMIYDHDIFTINEQGKKEWLQLKQTFGAGITIKY